MRKYACLAREMRGDLEDVLRLGSVCVVDESSRIVLSAGDPTQTIYLRSASKPIQALPTIERRLDERYGITEAESVIFSGSHVGQPCHIAALTSIFEKAGLSEDWLCMLPTAPECPRANEARLRAGLPMRRFYHNCSGKHAALMLLQRALGGDVASYWRKDAICQKEVARVIALFTETKESSLVWGTDGCGVPVFGVPLSKIAVAFKNLACPDRLADDSLAETTVRYLPRIHRYPHLLRGEGTDANVLCSLLNRDPNIITKSGANALNGIGLRRERLGIAVRAIDGCTSLRPLWLAAILKKIGYENQDTIALLENIGADRIINDTGEVVGRAYADIEWNE